MRALKYKLEDGTVVNTWAQAKESGQKYKEIFEPISLEEEFKKEQKKKVKEK